MRINQFFKQTETDYRAPEIKVNSLHRIGVICSSITGFDPGNMNEEDIEAENETL